MRKDLLLLPRNRVRRNYMGGAGIDALHGEKTCVDDNRPEEWIGSMTEASNPGMPPIPGEGLAMLRDGDRVRSLRDIVDEEKSFYLGGDLYPDGTWQLSFLYKILDSAMRLHVQAHPTTAFANARMGRPYGKLECYFILDVRPGQDGYIRLGFQHAPTRDEWREIIRTQDIPRMDACFERIPVRPGEVWYVPGGMPHAIGENITMLEIMEPSDLVVRCEFEREGLVVAPEARFMGRDLEFCLDIFDYTAYSVEEIRRRCRIDTHMETLSPGLWRRQLVGDTLTRCFAVTQYHAEGRQTLTLSPHLTLCVATAGEGTLTSLSSGERLRIRRGDSFLLAAAAGQLAVETDTALEWVAVQPGPDMRETKVQ